MKKIYSLQSNAIKGFRRIILPIVLIGGFLSPFGGLFAQIGPPFPDNVYNADCYTNVQATQWGIQASDTSNAFPSICALPFVGDIDNDGYNEVITLGNDSIIIYNHQLVEKITFPAPTANTVSPSMAIADVDNDGIAEIFFFSKNSRIFICYNYNGTTVTTKWQISISGIITSEFPVIADVNADGIPDIMVNDRIFNAQTGELEVNLSTINEIGAYPLFADMDNDGLLEVVGGNTVLKVNIVNPHGTGGNTAVIWKHLTDLYISDRSTSVADINLDGFMDAIVLGLDNNGDRVMYVWSPYTGISSRPVMIGHIMTTNTFSATRGIPLVADLNNDGYPEIAYTVTNKILVLCQSKIVG